MYQYTQHVYSLICQIKKFIDSFIYVFIYFIYIGVLITYMSAYHIHSTKEARRGCQTPGTEVPNHY